MAGILTEQDTFFGSIAFRNKLISREQLGEGVRHVQANPGTRLGDSLVQLGYLKPEQVQVVLDMQKEQRSLLEEREPPPAHPTPPVPEPAAPPPPPQTYEAYDPHAIELPDAPADAPTVRMDAETFAAPAITPEPPRPPQPEAPEPDSPQKRSIASALQAARDAIGLQSAPSDPKTDSGTNLLDLDADEESGGETPTVQIPSPPPPPPKPEPKMEAPEPERPKRAPSTVSGGTVSLEAGESHQVPSELTSLIDYLVYARAAGASDLHISVEVSPFMRRFGRVEKIDVPPMDAAQTERLLLEVLSKNQKTMMLDRLGIECCLDVTGQGRYRACIYKQRLGWDGVFHIIRGSVPTAEELGLPECLTRLTEYQQGLALITGPGNSGKTTTLAAMLNEINNNRDDHVITVESPVEYIHTPNRCQITQREVGLHTRSYSVALRAALREDPDIIMVGELRDLETLSMAITASETGHLVLGTLHTTSAVSTINRILDGFPVPQQPQIRMMLSESLRGIASQQLVPRADGKGVVLALEILLITSAVSSLIRDNQPFQIPSVMQTSRKMGMRRMDDSLLELAEAGLIDGAEAYRRAVNKQQFQMYKPQD